MNDAISPNVREFIIRYIGSVAEIETLLILRANAGKDWDTGRIAARVYASDRVISQVLERFVAVGFLERDGERYRYSVKDASADHTIGELARFYASHLILLTKMIHGKPHSMRGLSDAFEPRKNL